MEFDFVVHPGSDPAQISLRVDGLDEELEVTVDGDELILPTSVGDLRMALPRAWTVGMQDRNFDIAVEFIKVGENRLRIETPDGYNMDQTLVIDPLVYSTFLGGDGWDGANSICPDGMGGTILTGRANPGFPTTESAFDREATFCDAFICRINDDGSELVFSTFLGGGRNDYSNSVTSGEEGEILVTGSTRSNDFPTTEGAWDISLNGSNDAFITKLSEDGSELIYSTYLGGSGSDHSYHICDEDGNALVSGYSTSREFPTTDGAFDETINGSADGFVTCLNEDGSDLLWSTLIGGREQDFVYELYLAADGGIIAIGSTASSDFPTESAWDDSYNGDQDAYLVKFTSDGSELVFSTFLGGDSQEYGVTVCSNEEGQIFVAGSTESDNFPTTDGAWDSVFNDSRRIDGFISCFSEDGGEMVFSTYLGGRSNDQVGDICSAEDEGVFLVGITLSDNFPTTEDAYDPERASFNDVFITHLNAAGDNLIYSTYLGGRDHDIGNCIYIDGDDEFVVSGKTYSLDFPVTERAFDLTHNLNDDVFLTRIAVNPHPLFWSDLRDTSEVFENRDLEFMVIGGALDEEAELTIDFRSDDLPDAAEFEDFRDGSGTFYLLTTYEDAGEYTATFILSDGENELSGNVGIIVYNLNRSPEWGEFPDTVGVDEGERLSFRITASDPDEDPLLFTVSNHDLLDGWEFEDNGNGTGDFTWSPSFEDAGDYFVIFELTDGVDTLFTQVDIVVHDFVSISEHFVQIPDHYYLSEAYPNPFNSQTQIIFGLPFTSVVSLTVFDLSGRMVKILLNEQLHAGIHSTPFTASDLPSGLYVVRMATSVHLFSRKVMLIK